MQEQQFKNKPKVIEAVVEGVEKRRSPSKYYVYRMRVLFGGGQVLGVDGARTSACSRGGSMRQPHILIFRRYSEFSDLDSDLSKKFPIEAGARSSKDRIIPDLPGVLRARACP